MRALKAEGPEAVGSVHLHAAKGHTPCACEQQTLGAVPWMMLTLGVLLAWQIVRRAKKKRGQGRR